VLFVPLWLGLSLAVQTALRARWRVSPVPFSVLPAGRRALGLTLGGVVTLFTLWLWGFIAAHESRSEGTSTVKVAPDTAAAQAGLETGDIVTRVNGKSVTWFADIIAARGEPLDAPVELEWTHQGEARHATVTPNATLLGIGAQQFELRQPSFGEAAALSAKFIVKGPWVVLNAMLRGHDVKASSDTVVMMATQGSLFRSLFPTAIISWWLALLGEWAVSWFAFLLQRPKQV